MSKRAEPVKKRKRRENWKQLYMEMCSIYEAAENDCTEAKAWMAERKGMLFSASNELSKYRLLCDWACQRIEKLEARAVEARAENLEYMGAMGERDAYATVQVHLEEEIEGLTKEKRILLDTLFEVQAENIMQGEDILRQRDELIKLRGVAGERISCQR